MPRFWQSLSVILFAVAPCLAIAAETAPALPAGDDVENIVVTGQRPSVLRKLMLDFIFEIGDPTDQTHGYARWRDEVCVSVQNLNNKEAAQYIVDRISAVALELGLEPGAPGCRPGLFIVFTSDGAAMARKMVQTSPRVFRPFGGTGGTTQGTLALEEFQNSDAPVRWWQITMVVDELGYAAIDLSNGVYDIPMIRGTNSRIRNSVSDDLWGSYVIVDASKIGAFRIPQLADYLAMVSLAQINPSGLPSNHDSILNLFKADQPVSGLTELDLSYLRALYTMDTMLFPHMQHSLMAATMMRVQSSLVEAE